MVNIDRVRVSLTGFPGAPGVNTFYYTTAPTHLDALRAFYVAVAPYVPQDVTFTIETAGDTIDPLSGLIVGSWTAGAEAAVVGGAPGAYAAPVGAVISWHTTTVVDGRRLRGRTFLVPLQATVFESNGSLVFSAQGALAAAAANLITASAGALVIHNRPRKATPSWTDVQGRIHPAKVDRAGGFSAVTAATVPDVAAVLRSRRD